VRTTITLAICILSIWQSAESKSPTDLEARIDGLFANIVGGRSPGFAVLVSENGRVIVQKGYGFADVDTRRRISPETKFRIGSITKQFTSVAILKLQEQGRLSLDDHLSKFIPDYPRGEEVSLYHLLTHTSGLRDYTTKTDFLENVTRPTTTQALIESFKQDGYDSAPGDRYRYNNSGYVLLGYVIERASGMTYGAYLRRTFFDTLEMRNTGVYRSGHELRNEARGYANEGGSVVPAADWDTSQLGAAGSLYSTVSDLNRWSDALFNGEVLSAASLEQALTIGVLRGDDPRYPLETGYGLGFEIADLNGLRQVGHGGELVGFGGYLLHVPEGSITVVVLHNCLPQLPGGHQWNLARDIARLAIGDSLPPGGKPQIDRTLSLGAFKAIAGRYDMGDGMMLTIAREGTRVFADIPGRTQVEIFPRSERTFFAGDGEAEATFVRAGDGKVIKAILQQAGGRIDAWKVNDVPRRLQQVPQS
jgi:CubicO group peptidase (beta-lactamase class C family)